MKRSKIAFMGFLMLVLAGLTDLANSQGTAITNQSNVPKDMVLVPAGEFMMGLSEDDRLKECRKFYGDKCQRESFTYEAPAHKVYLDAFYIDTHEATQAEYNKCVAAGKCEANQKHKGFTGARQPVVGVTWENARSYCSSVGKRLPTEAEWEKAARGTDGRIYPWGNEFNGTKANFCDKDCTLGFGLKNWDDGYATTTASVGSYPAGASPYGALDMAGNVWEWTEDWYSKDYYEKSPAKNPKGPDNGSSRVLRGGCWGTYWGMLLTSSRLPFNPMEQNSCIGFRCAKSP